MSQKNERFKFTDIELSTPIYYIETILKRWSAGYSRKKNRKESSHTARVCIGLSSLYDHISHFFSEKSHADVVDDTLNEFSDVQEINLDKYLFQKMHVKPKPKR